MLSRSAKTLAAAAVIVFGFAAVFALSGYVENVRPPLPAGFEDENLAVQGAKLRGFSLGAEGLLADWYWMNSLQYIGKKVIDAKDDTINLDDLRSLNPRLLYPYLNTSTDLDPRFITAYSYGANVLPAINSRDAIRLTEKGIANNPGEWRLYQYLGYIYWKLKQYEKASEVYAKGAQISGAPPFMQMMAAAMKTKGGSRDTARELYRQLLQEAQDEQTKHTAELRLLELDSLDERDGLRSALAQFKEKNGRCAQNWNELLPVMRSVSLPNGREFRIDRSNSPVDPTDAPYVLNSRTCEVELDADRTKVPIF